MIFDHRDITTSDYYFVVKEGGDAWTDTKNFDRAKDTAQRLSASGNGQFSVYDSTGKLFTTK